MLRRGLLIALVLTPATGFLVLYGTAADPRLTWTAAGLTWAVLVVVLLRWRRRPR